MESLTDVLGRSPSAQLLLDKYTRLALVVDEVINEVQEGQTGSGPYKLQDCTSHLKLNCLYPS